MINKEIQVSIVVPVYNTSRYLDECLSSLVNQTLRENSLEILNSWAKRDNRITIIDLKVSMRQGAARNLAIKASKGKYIGLVDSDDYIAPTMYEELISMSENGSADIVVSNLYATYKGTVCLHK